MKQKGQKVSWVKAGILFTIAVVIKIISLFNGWVEAYYSSGFYQYISRFLRMITGWLPFSLGDVLYGLVAIWLIIKLFQFCKALFKHRITKANFFSGIINGFIKICWIYILFNLLWGLNYNRLGIAYQLQLEPVDYNTADLKQLTTSLIEKVNASRKILGDSSFQYPSTKQIFAETEAAYSNAETKFPFLHYQNTSIKSSMYGELGNYIGFLGYYNPFSGESQVNTTVPSFVIPYTTCHEVAHQLGYGSESEANFVGYLAAKNSNEKTFRYSAYFELFTYANGELFYYDSVTAKENYKLLDTLVKLDIKKYREFLKKHKNPVEPLMRVFYGEYLKANNQPKGMDTYDEVISWLIAYQRKYGEL